VRRAVTIAPLATPHSAYPGGPPLWAWSPTSHYPSSAPLPRSLLPAISPSCRPQGLRPTRAAPWVAAPTNQLDDPPVPRHGGEIPIRRTPERHPILTVARPPWVVRFRPHAAGKPTRAPTRRRQPSRYSSLRHCQPKQTDAPSLPAPPPSGRPEDPIPSMLRPLRPAYVAYLSHLRANAVLVGYLRG
jgi:hypothetical protein